MSANKAYVFDGEPTVIMSRHELDVVLDVERSLAAREHIKPTTVMSAITPEMVEQYKLQRKSAGA